MASAEVREILLKLGLDDNGFSSGLKRAQADINKTAGAGLALASALGGATATIGVLISAIGRGQAFNEVSGAFEKTGISIEKLRKSSQGLISDFDLIKTSNFGSSLGLSAENLELLAKSADALGDAVGVGTREAFQTLTEALGKTNERALKSLGINLDLETVYRKGASALGVEVSALNENAKALLFRASAIDEVRKKTEESSSASASAGDGLDKLNVSFTNVLDKVTSAIEKNPQLEQTFLDLASGLDIVAEKASIIVEVLQDITTVVFKTSAGISSLGENFAILSKYLGADFAQKPVDQIKLIDESISNLQEKLKGDPSTQPSRFKDTFANLQKPILEEIEALKAKKEQLLKVGEVQDQYAGAVKNTGTELDSTIKILTQSKSQYIDNSKAVEDAKKSADEYAKGIAGLNKEFDKLTASSQSDQIKNNVDKIFESVSLGKFDSEKFGQQMAALQKASEQEYLAGVDVVYRKTDEAIRNSKLAGQKAVTEVAGELGDRLESANDKSTKDLQQKLTNVVSFFEDAFYNVFTGKSFDFEDAFARLASGFASQLAASITNEVLPAFGDLISGDASVSGLGKALAKELGSALSSEKGGLLSSVFGDTEVLGLGSLSLSAGAPAWLAAIPAATAALVASSAQENFSGSNDGRKVGATGIDAIFPGVGSILGKLGVFGGLGGGGKGAQEAAARSAFRDSLKGTLGDNLEFNGVRGAISLNDSKYDLSRGRNAFSDQATALANPLGQIFGKGDDKLSEDIAGIFADATDNAKSYNEVIINTQALMGKLGITAEEAKGQLSDLFLDGKVNLDEFSSGLSSLNVVAQDSLVGTGSVVDGLRLVSDETLTNRARLKALQLTFKEFGEIGISTSQDMVAYLTERLGPDAATVFSQLATSGIDSFEDIKNASADQIAVIFQILSNLKDKLSDTFKGLGEEVASGLEKGAEAITKSANNFKDVDINLNSGTPTRKNASRIDDNIPNFRRA